MTKMKACGVKVLILKLKLKEDAQSQGADGKPAMSIIA